MKTAFLALVGLALALPAPAAARDLPSLTPDPGSANFQSEVSFLASNGTRTLAGGELRSSAAWTGGGAIVSGTSGAAPRYAAVGEVTSAISDGAGGWYVGNDLGRVFRVRSDGSLAFSASAASDPVIALAAGGGRVWAGGTWGIAALDAVTGQALTRLSQSASDLAVSGSTLYAAGRNTVTALDPASGAVLASGPAGLSGTGVVAGSDAVYVSTQPVAALALDPVTLAERWRANTGWAGRDVAVTGGRVLVTGQNAGVSVFDASTGERVPFSLPLADAGPIALSEDGSVGYLGLATPTAAWPFAGAVAFATRDGALLGWAPRMLSATAVRAIAVSGSRVFLDSDSGVVTRKRPQTAMLDETGAVTPWVDAVNGLVTSVALDRANTAYVARTTSVSATDRDGALRWRAALTGATSLALSPDEQTLYVGGSQPLALRVADGSPVPWPVSVSGGTVAGTVFGAGVQFVYGSFTAINGMPRNGVAALDANGAVLPFAPPRAGTTSAAQLSPDGSTLWVAGKYPVDDFHTDYLLGLRTSDGSIAVTADTGSVKVLAPLADGQSIVYSGGGALFAVDAHTGARLDWQFGGCGDCSLRALALSPDGQTVHVGGAMGVPGHNHYLRPRDRSCGQLRAARASLQRVILGRRQLNRALLARQGLLERRELSIPDALDAMGTLQAQYAPSMYVGLWSRVAGFQREALTRALEEREVAQGTLMRITIHLVSRADYWPLAHAVEQSRRAQWLRVSNGTDLTDAAGTLRDALQDGPLTRKEIEHLIGREALRGINTYLHLLRVPPSGTWERRRADLFALAESCIDKAPPRPGHLVTRYLTGYGPAAKADIASWAGMSLRELEPELAATELVEHEAEDGATLYDLPDMPLPDPDTPAPVRFLPTWDATLLVHARRALVLPEDLRERIFHIKMPQSIGTFLVDGQVAGTWRPSGELQYFADVDPHPVEQEAARLAEFIA